MLSYKCIVYDWLCRGFFLARFHLFSANVTNSPKLQLPERGARPKRLGTNLGSQPRLANAGAGATPEASGSSKPQSPALSRWKKIREQVRR